MQICRKLNILSEHFTASGGYKGFPFRSSSSRGSLASSKMGLIWWRDLTGIWDWFRAFCWLRYVPVCPYIPHISRSAGKRRTQGLSVSCSLTQYSELSAKPSICIGPEIWLARSPVSVLGSSNSLVNVSQSALPCCVWWSCSSLSSKAKA